MRNYFKISITQKVVNLAQISKLPNKVNILKFLIKTFTFILKGKLSVEIIKNLKKTWRMININYNNLFYLDSNS